MAPAVASRAVYAGLEMDGRPVSPAFIGRLDEIAAARHVLRGVEDRQASHLLIAGEAGIGKTRFAGAVADIARTSGFIVLWGSCIDLGDGDQIPYAAIADVLRDLASATDEVTLGQVIAGHEDALGRITRRLGQGRAEPAPRLQRTVARSRILDALRIVAERVAARAPVLMVVDDLHWADPATLEALGVLARSPRDWRFGLLMTFRSDETGGHKRLRDWLGDVERLSGVLRLDLGPLSLEETGDLLAAMRGAPPDTGEVACIHTRSDGNPLFIEALAAGGAAVADVRGITPGLRDILVARFARASDASARLLRLAAVAGRDVDAKVLAAASGTTGQALDAAIAAGIDCGLLVVRRTPSGDRIGCRHALIGEVIEAELMPGERMGLHRALAEALVAAAGAPGTAELGSWAEITLHWDSARDERQTLAAAVLAGAEAERAFAFTQALAHYRRALAAWQLVLEPASVAGIDRIELLGRAATAAWLAGGPGSVELLHAAVAEADRIGDDVQRAMQRTRLARALWITGDPIASSQMYAQAEAAMPPGPPTPERARLQAGLANHAMLEGRHRRAMFVAERAIALARESGARRIEGDALDTLACSASELGFGSLARASYEQSLAIALEGGDPDDIGRIEHNATEILSLAGDDERALQLALANAARMDAMGMGIAYGAFIRVHAAVVAHELGKWQLALELVTGFDLEDLDPLSEVYVLARKVGMSVDRGEWELADRQIARIGGLLDLFVTEDQQSGPYAVARAELALWRGQPAAAKAAIEHGLERLERTDDVRYRVRLRQLGVRAAADLAELARIRHDPTAVASAVAAADAIRARTATAVDRVGEMDGGLAVDMAAELASAGAEQARLMGEVDLEAWQRASEAWRRRGRPYREAYTLYRTAETALTAGDRRTACEALRAASRTGAQLGAGPLRQASDALARRSRIALEPPADRGASVGTPGPSHPCAEVFGLTPREVDVLELLAKGMTNSQIADSLFISANTVGVHVSRVLNKLGVGTRTEAASVAYRLDGARAGRAD
jgi:DNA-binding CsgD family transcriptional regulator/tetratricopeptide (TPR) repeat protein